MINFLSNWIEQIAVAVIIVSIFEMILPNGNIKKYIKVVLGVYIMFCVISPFLNKADLFKLDEFKLEDYVSKTNTNVNQETMDLRLKQLYIEQLQKDIEKKVNESGYQLSKCNIDATTSEIRKINLILSKNKIDIQKVEIGFRQTEENQKTEEMENLREELANYYEIDKNIINIKIN